MGNIARMPNPGGFERENTKSAEEQTQKEMLASKINYSPEISGYPRYAEGGARYWMQWAGVPRHYLQPHRGKKMTIPMTTPAAACG